QLPQIINHSVDGEVDIVAHRPRTALKSNIAVRDAVRETPSEVVPFYADPLVAELDEPPTMLLIPRDRHSTDYQRLSWLRLSHPASTFRVMSRASRMLWWAENRRRLACSISSRFDTT